MSQRLVLLNAGVQIGKRVRTWRGHSNFVNGVSVCDTDGDGGRLIASGADDGTTKLWDARSRQCVQTLPLTFQVRGARAYGRRDTHDARHGDAVHLLACSLCGVRLSRNSFADSLLRCAHSRVHDASHPASRSSRHAFVASVRAGVRARVRACR